MANENPLRHAFPKVIRENKLQEYFKLMQARDKETQKELIADLKHRGYTVKRSAVNSIGNERYILGEDGEPIAFC